MVKEEARRGRRTGGALVILLFLLALPAWPLAPAAGQGTVREHVEARLEVAMTSPTGGTLDGNFSFFVYELNGTVARADEIRASILSPEGCNTRCFIERNARLMLIGHFLGRGIALFATFRHRRFKLRKYVVFVLCCFISDK